MPNLNTIASATIDVSPYPSRSLTRSTIRNRRAAIKKILWPLAKASVILLGVFVREVFL